MFKLLLKRKYRIAVAFVLLYAMLLGACGLETGAPAAPAETAAPADSTDAIVLTSYAPNELRYHYSASADRLAVFSEIYYPDGWKAEVDGSPVEVVRADWTLRAAQLPAGEHDLVMRFMPESYRIGANVSRASSIALILLLLLSIASLFLPARKKE